MNNYEHYLLNKGYKKLNNVSEEGNFSKVFRYVTTKLISTKIDILKKNTRVSIKIVNLLNIKKNDEIKIKNEIKAYNIIINEYKNNTICKKKNINSIIKIFDILEYNHYIFIIMEEMDIDLVDFVFDYLHLDNHQDLLLIAKGVLYYILKGLECLSKLSILHNDLKPENIMIKFDKNKIKSIKIIDFNCILFMNEECRECCSTKTIMSPNIYEYVLNYSNHITSKSDIFSLGIIAYYILSKGEYLFEKSIKPNTEDYLKLDYYGKSTSEYIKNLTNRDENKRFTIKKALSSNFLKPIGKILKSFHSKLYAASIRELHM